MNQREVERIIQKAVLDQGHTRSTMLVSLKAGSGRIGGVDPQSYVYRAIAEDGRSSVVKYIPYRPAEQEVGNLFLLNELAPEHGVYAATDGRGMIFMYDLGEDSLASLSAISASRARRNWLKWAEALATVHARSLEPERRLHRLRGTRWPLTAKQLQAILQRAERRLGVDAFDAPGALMVALTELSTRLREELTVRRVFGFDDPNPANVMIDEGKVHFIDVSGPPFGLISRALTETWRAPDPEAVIEHYRLALNDRGVQLSRAELREERELYKIASSIEWIQTHLKEAAGGGVRDIDGSQGDPVAAVRSNLETVRRLSEAREWLRPVALEAARLLDAGQEAEARDTDSARALL